MEIAEIFLGFGLCAITSMSFGFGLARLLRLPVFGAEALALSFVLGSGVTSLFTFAVGVGGFAQGPVFVGVGVSALLLLIAQRAWVQNLFRGSSRVPWRCLVFFAGYLPYSILYLKQALAPEMSPDGMDYHLGLVNLWAHEGRIYRIVDIFNAVPQGVEMLFLFAFSIGRHSAAALTHLSFLLALPVLILQYGTRFGWTLMGSVFAALLVFASPICGINGTVAYNDVALATTAFASVYLLELWRRMGSPGALIASGLAIGFAVSIKYTAIPLVFVIVAVVLWEQRYTRSARPGLATALLFAAGCVLPVSVYLARNWLWFQNPIGFFGNSIFENRWFHASRERSFARQAAEYHGVRWPDLPLALTVGTAKLPQSFGPVFLLMPLCCAGIRWRETRIPLLAALALALPYFANKDPRFLMPMAPLAALSLSFTLSWIPKANAVLAGALGLHLLISWPYFMDALHFPPVWQWRITPVTWKEALRIVPEEAYLSRSLDYVMARQIDAMVPAGEPVFAFTGGAAQSYTSHHLIVCWKSAFGERMADLLFSRWHSPGDKREHLRFNLPDLPFRTLQLIQQGSDPEAAWNVDEVQMWAAGKRLAFPKGTQITARPNPWDTGLAFDGELATRWRSWDTLRPGMYISVEFPSPERIDSVEAILDNREWTTLEEERWPARVLLEASTSGGAMTRVSPQISFDVPVDLRREATREMERSGIRYILINSGDWEQRQFRENPAAWNMHAIAWTASATLYRLD